MTPRRGNFAIASAHREVQAKRQMGDIRKPAKQISGNKDHPFGAVCKE
jgi:hypothetical protein